MGDLWIRLGDVNEPVSYISTRAMQPANAFRINGIFVGFPSLMSLINTSISVFHSLYALATRGFEISQLSLNFMKNFFFSSAKRSGFEVIQNSLLIEKSSFLIFIFSI